MKVFISYRRRNGGQETAYVLCQKLRRLGIDVFYDHISLRKKSNNYQEEIKRNVESCDYFLLLLQPNLFDNLIGNDFVQEILFAQKKKIIPIAINPTFAWEQEKSRIPPELKDINLPVLNITQYNIAEIDELIGKLIDLFEQHQEHNGFYRFLHEAEKSASSAFMVPEAVITNIPLEHRWNNVKQVSLLSVGGGSILGPCQPTVSKLLKQGVTFRFITVDHRGKSKKDIERKKIYSAFAGQDNGYLKQREKQIKAVISHMKASTPLEYRDNIAYRVTDEHITMTLQWVEREACSYVFASFLPTIATERLQADCGCALITDQNPLYKFFTDQFEEIWKQSRIIIPSRGLQ